MPRVFDRRIPANDKDPLANLLDFENWAAYILEGAENAGVTIKSYIDSLLDTVVDVIHDLTGLDLSALADVLQGLDLSSPEAFLTSLWSAILALPDALIEVIAGVIGDPQFVNLFSLFGSIDFTDPTFDPLQALLTWADESLANPLFLTGDVFTRWNLTGHPSISDLILPFPLPGILGEPVGPVLPFGLPSDPLGGFLMPGGPLQNWVTNILGFLSADYTADGFDLAAALDDFINNRLKPRDLLAELVDGVLPDSQAPAVVAALRDAIAGIIGSTLADIETRLQHIALDGLLANAGIPGLQFLQDAVAGVVDSAVSDVEERLRNISIDGLFDAEFIGNILNIPTIPDTAVLGVPINQDNIVKMLLGWAGSGFTYEQAAAALGQTADVGVYTSAQIEALWAAINTGVVALDDFSYNASDIAALWDSTTTPARGNWTANGSNAVWDFTSAGDAENISRFTGTNPTSTGDYQTVTATLGSGPTYMFLAGNFHGGNSVCGRMNAAKTHYIKLRARENRYWELVKVINGVPTVMASSNIAPGAPLATAPGPGTRLELVCGDKTNSIPRHFVAKVGTVVVASGVFGDTTSSFGSGFRGWGFGGDQDGPGLAFDAAKPGNVNQWIGQDTA